MHKTAKIFVISILLVLLVGQGYVFAKKCPEETEVPLAKAMNPGFSDMYKKCDIVVIAEMSAPSAEFYPFSIPYDHTVFEVVPPGFPYVGGKVHYHVIVPNEDAELVFQLKRGELVKLHGSVNILRYMQLRKTVFFTYKIEKMP